MLCRVSVWKGFGGDEISTQFLAQPRSDKYIVLACSAAYFGRAKAACLCSYCCNHHLCYDGGRLGRVKIVTLRVGARAKKGPPPLFRVSTCAFASKTFAHPKKTPALQANIVQFDTTSTQSHSKPQNALRLFWGVGHN